MLNADNKNNGRYGEFGGCYIPEGLVAPIHELTQAFEALASTKAFQLEFRSLLKNYAGRPTPLTEANRFSNAIKGPRVFLKREDLLHTGAHKLNNALGQCLLAKKMGKTRIVAETGAGQHGVATATACAYLNLACVIYMGAVDMKRQAPNVDKMKLLGATVIPVISGSQTLKDAVNESLRDYAATYSNTHYCLGSALGPHPYPQMVAAFQSMIGEEARYQIQEQIGSLPDAVIACVGGGSNAIGIFSGFISDSSVKLIGVEAGGKGNKLGEHAARLQDKKMGILHGTYTYLLQDDQGQVAPTYSISAGLDYPAIGPQHAELHAIGRAQYTAVTDQEALKAFKLLSKTEGIIPALESSHALAYLMTQSKDEFNPEQTVIINLSGRGDKDLPQLFESKIL